MAIVVFQFVLLKASAMKQMITTGIIKGMRHLRVNIVIQTYDNSVEFHCNPKGNVSDIPNPFTICLGKQ
ncbi:MAG: hypothetical protein JO327_11580 [Nitrososphaeraceae archaeon]|nr:hypothetical protein [Nitrososphaeraceae archaeon]MBV9668756.1 hypothetical protein [Nitrososphaeraceae archaeon]